MSFDQSKASTRSYRREFELPVQARAYATHEYHPRSWSSLLWELEREFLHGLLNQVTFVPSREQYIDFACGTGRVISAVGSYFSHSMGVDISDAMLDVARSQVPKASFVQFDVHDGRLDIEAADLITMFRFVLNADKLDRIAALRWAADHLRNDNSRLIVNNHGHLAPHKRLSRRLRQKAPGSTTGNLLAEPELLALFDSAGLCVEQRKGFGLLGGRISKQIGYAASRRLNSSGLARRLERYCENQVYVLRRK